MSNPSRFIAQGHRLVERGVALARAASAVATPDLGFPADAVTDSMSSLTATSRSLGDLLADTGDDLAFVSRMFVSTDGRVGSVFIEVFLGGRFT